MTEPKAIPQKKEKKKEDENLLNDNKFVLNLKKDGKKIELNAYSFSIQIKLMKSGLLNRLMELQKMFPDGEDVKMENLDFVQLGELLELAVDIIYEMLPKSTQLTADKAQLTDDIKETEPMRFINWLIGQFGKSNAFLAQENPPEVKSPE